MNIATDPALLEGSPLAPPAEAQAPARRRLTARRLALGLAMVGLVAGLAYAGDAYWTRWRFEVSTDDAYVQADIVPIAPEVPGYLKTVDVIDNQPVRKGDRLATIDPRDYEAAVHQAEADVAEARATIDDRQAQLREQQSQVQEARAELDADKARQVFAEQNNTRFGTLAHDGFGSVETAQQARAQTDAAVAQVARDAAALDAAQKRIDTLTAQIAEAQATLAHNQAVLEKARLNLSYTDLRAPVDGTVGARALRVGAYVEPGTQLLAVVPLQATYIVANYKETQLADVAPGQPVSIAVDTFGGESVRGTVDSLAPASGQTFALLPPDNATGNFTKIVQRIPVRISLDPTDPLAGRLRPGMSVTTTIDVSLRPAAGAKAGN